MRCKFSSLISLPEHNTRHGNRASRVCQASWSLKIWTCLGCCVSPQEDWSFQYPVPENKVERFLRWKQRATNVIYLKCRGLVVSLCTATLLIDSVSDVMALNSQIQNLLRSPDEIKVILEATFVPAIESDSPRNLQSRRILAIVSHKDDWDLTEEGT